MRHKGIVISLLLVWGTLTLAAWFSPPQSISNAERRTLAQKPSFTVSGVLDGSYMEDFADASVDQFPLRDSFRTVKALAHYGLLRQGDNNGVYLAQGQAAKMEYPLKEASVGHALDRFQAVYQRYLTDSQVYMAIVPDKGFYLAQDSGHLTMDYDRLYTLVAEGTPWAVQVDLRAALTAQSYYPTDTHWRQEALLPVAQALCQAMDAAPPKAEDYTLTALDRPFYGVYYGQSALPLAADTLYLMESPLLAACQVYDHETGKTQTVYDLSKLDSRDLYDVYLSGARSLLTIHNPAGDADRELIVFRDSFGSSLTPLLLQGYRVVTLVDLRYIRWELLGDYLDFAGKDVLLLYSTLILNNSAAL